VGASPTNRAAMTELNSTLIPEIAGMLVRLRLTGHKLLDFAVIIHTCYLV